MIAALLLAFGLLVVAVGVLALRLRRVDEVGEGFTTPTDYVRLGIDRPGGLRLKAESALRELPRARDASIVGAGTMRKIRVVVGAVGVDGHERDANVIARALRDAGAEVICTVSQTPERIVNTAIEEDADAVGLSVPSGAHMTVVPRVIGLLREQGAEDVEIAVGGTIPADDVSALEALGVGAIFSPGVSMDTAVHGWARSHRGRRARGL